MFVVNNICITFADVNNKQITIRSGGNRKFGIWQMNKKQTSVLLALAAIAINNKEGYTVNAATLQPVTSGYAVAVADTQNSFGLDGLKNVVQYVENHPEVNAFGGWYNSDNNMYYYDATVIVDDLEAAKELGRINNQIAIFDLANLEEIRL